MACNIVGQVVIPDGSSAANRQITLRKEDFTLSAQGTLSILPEEIVVYTDASGNVDFDLVAGTYSGYYVSSPDGRAPFRLRVPADAVTANFADLIVVTSVTYDPALTQLVLDAKYAIENGGSGGGGTNAVWGSITGTLTNQADLNTALNGKASTASVALKADTTSLVSGLALKADTTTVNSALALKANITDVTAGLALKADTSTVNSALSLKADTTALALKANITDVTAGLAGKSDTGHTHTFSEITSKPTTLSGYGITDGVTTTSLSTTLSSYSTTSAADLLYQPKDAGLTALANLSTSALYYLSAADTWSPVIIGPNLNFSGGTLSATGGGASTWGSITGTLSSQTDLNTALNLKANSASLAAVATSGLFSDITGGDIPWLVPDSGHYVLTTLGSGTNLGTVPGGAGRMDLYPFSPGATTAYTGVAVNCTTPVAPALARVVVYEADSNGRPSNLLYTSSDLDCSTTGQKTATTALTLSKGAIYWIGVWTSSTATLSAWGLNQTPDINGGTSISTQARKILRRTVSFIVGAPNPWNFNASEITGGATATAVWFKV